MILTLLPPAPLPLPPLVSLADAVALPTVTVAVLVNVAGGVALTVALMVKVTLLLLVKEGMVMPESCMAAILQLAQGHSAPEQVTLLTARPVTAGSLKTALVAPVKVVPVVLVMTTV
jgi:hypothetical protein